MLSSGTDIDAIVISNARVHNLKNVSLTIPRNRFIVITGLSGSGKSSLAFDTIYAEGQRRYVESLSAYARQFLGRMNKPEVDYIKGIPPAIAVEQKVNTRNPRSTVGTSTEIYDYLKLLYARTGKTYSPVSGGLVRKDNVSDVVDYITSCRKSTRLLILAPLHISNSLDLSQQLEDLSYQGIARIEADGEIIRISELKNYSKKIDPVSLKIVIDRVTASKDEDSAARYADSVQMSFRLGSGICIIKSADGQEPQEKIFSNRFELDGIHFEEPTVHMFSFNNPVGACPLCEGYGKIIGIDPDLVIPDKGLSVYEDAIACWKGEKMKRWKEKLIYNAGKFGFPVHKPYFQLNDEQKQLLWTGNRFFRGLNAFFKYLESKKYKIQYRVMLARYRGKTVCTECDGTRLKKEASYVRIGNKTIQQLVSMPVDELRTFFKQLKLSRYENKIAGRILEEINTRLEYLSSVGLGYLTLNRLSSTLSGGESQRINLATTLGSSLVGSLYILDEPSIGLHPRDTHLLIDVLQKLKKIGNTVMVVEHEEEIIRAAEEVIDIGPFAGRLGGEILFRGTVDELLKNGKGLTSRYLNGLEHIEVPSRRRKWNNYLEFTGARHNNLKNIDVKIPLNVITVVSGVSGSGKSSLVKNIIYPSLGKIYNDTAEKAGEFGIVRGDIKALAGVELIDQHPIGKSSRSNPVTYIKAYDEIRKLMADQPQSRLNGFKPAHFSFNVDGGRCSECQGEGEVKVEMQFMADVHLTCESCNGKRFKDEILEVRYHGKNIYDILECTVNEAIEFFNQHKDHTAKNIVKKLKPLADVGLGYIKLGQSSSTLSGGESQRVKLASFLAMENASSPTLFIFDEPTTGLHFHDIRILLKALNELIEKGHSVLIVEHNMEMIKSADWLIDLGPEGGVDGGHIVYQGVPEGIIQCAESYTGKFLQSKLAGNS
ncbi:MAG: excinuclease ABC subunit UvrA [Bacteroidales bacterium]|nr:excinuclease ABC subunit UvrA [Bacteroidales bacterium]